MILLSTQTAGLNRWTVAFCWALIFILITGIQWFINPTNALADETGLEADAEFDARVSAFRRINWERYTPGQIRKKTPAKIYGNDVNLMPVQMLLFLNESFYIEMKPIWKAAGISKPDIIVIANGVYDLKRLHRLIADPSIFQRVNTDTYIAYRPLYVAPTASLIIRGKELRLSLQHGASILYHGKMYFVDARLNSWDTRSGSHGPRAKIPEEELLLYGKQPPRPYLLGLHGSNIYAANTNFDGLGYKGRTGSYGITLLSPAPKEPVITDLKSGLRHRARATGWFIGNSISQQFFGFYTDTADDVIFVGNVLHDNVIYNIDPHDYSEHLLIARNLTYHARHAHGIIFSRGVTDSIVAENLSVKNHGAGIMLDRSSENNLIMDNISIENRGDGIAIFESSDNLLAHNTAARNGRNGINIRNSCQIQAVNNDLLRNGNHGAEVAVVDIGSLETRDFVLDPYRQLASASFRGNKFDSNLNSALSSKNGSRIRLHKNRFENSAPLYFSGEMEPFTHQALMQNQSEGFERTGENSCPR